MQINKIIIKNNYYSNPTFSFINRFLRYIWGIVWFVLFLPSPRSFHYWRNLLLKLFGARIGKNVHVYPKVKIWAPWNLTLGDNIGIADDVNLYSMDKIIIDDFAVISQGSFLCCGSHKYEYDNFQLYTKPIKIKSNVWICAESFIHPGVEIPKGVIIGARGVVTRSLELEWAIYAGNPVQFIKYRKNKKV